MWEILQYLRNDIDFMLPWLFAYQIAGVNDS